MRYAFSNFRPIQTIVVKKESLTTEIDSDAFDLYMRQQANRMRHDLKEKKNVQLCTAEKHNRATC